MKTKQEHIAHMRANLDDAQSRLRDGKITAKQYNALRRDVKRRISEIRSEPKEFWQ